MDAAAAAAAANVDPMVVEDTAGAPPQADPAAGPPAPQADPAAANLAADLSAINLTNADPSANTKNPQAFPGNYFDGINKTTSKSFFLTAWQIGLKAVQAPVRRWPQLAMTKLSPQVMHHVLESDSYETIETWTWDDFRDRFMRVPMGRTVNTDQAALQQVDKMRFPHHRTVEAAVRGLESTTSSMSSPPDDTTRIHFTLAAIHPDLRGKVMHDSSGRDWASYVEFRQHLLSQAAVFEADRPPTYTAGSSRPSRRDYNPSYTTGSNRPPRRDYQPSRQPAGTNLQPKHNAMKRRGNPNRAGAGSGSRPPLADVECYNCHRKGHYSNTCPEKKKR